MFDSLQTPLTVTLQAPLSVGFFRQEYWSALPFPLPGDPPDPGIKCTSPVSPALQMDSLHKCIYSMFKNQYFHRYI